MLLIVDILKRRSGCLFKSFTATDFAVRCSRDPGRFFASRLYDAMKGLGTDESTLIRIMVSRCEVSIL